MEYNIVTNIQNCYSDIPALLYYSHLPTAAIMLFVGFFVYFKNNKLLSARLLFLMAFFFSLWVVIDIIVWINPDSRIVMFLWSLVNLFEIFVSISTLYFSYVFLKKKDVSFGYKFFVGLLVLPFIISIPTNYTLFGFSADICEAQQGIAIYYFYFLESIFSLWLFGFLLKNYFHTLKKNRKQVVIFSFGVVFFIFSFSGANMIASITGNWHILQYGLFSAPMFAGFLAFLIVRYHAFDIKLIGAQGLVVTQFILIGSMLFFTQNLVNYILIGVTLVMTLVAGWALIVSVKQEIKRKEELQKISDSLAVANERLKVLDNAKSEFISIASHQLRTPLTAIKGYTSLLLEGAYGKVPVPIHDILEKIYMVNTRLVQLVEDLLNISRIEAGRIQYNFVPTQLEMIVAELVDMFMLAARNKHLTLKIKLPSKTLPKILMDPNKIKEVVSNLIDNAIKYTIEGGVTVTVESRSSVARIVVSDTGIGIHPEDKDKLFDKFTRTQETTKMVVSGIGLGLYVGKNFIAAHGGKIWAESEGHDKGSRFIVELPFVNPNAKAGISDHAAPMPVR